MCLRYDAHLSWIAADMVCDLSWVVTFGEGRVKPATRATMPVRDPVCNFIMSWRTYSLTVWTLIVMLSAISLFVSPRTNPFKMPRWRAVKWQSVSTCES